LQTKRKLEDIMYGRMRSPVWEMLLFLLSLVYGMLVRSRHALFAFHVLAKKKLPCSVISVGNITLGGTGKTPMVVHIAEILSKHGKRPLVVSRGYGRSNEGETVVVSDGRSILADPKVGGDEPVLIAGKLDGIPVVVGNSRYESSLLALERFAPDTVILDDGFQHVQLRRDLDIVLVDAAVPLDQLKLFPAGILREPLRSLKRSTAVVITKAGQNDDLDRIRLAIRRHSRAEIFTSRMVPIDLKRCDDHAGMPLSALSGARVIAFSGIARPESFTSFLRSLGADVVNERAYQDHYQYTDDDLAAVRKTAADEKAEMIVTTEKDAVRLQRLNAQGVWALRIRMEVVERERWERFLMRGLV
jgi:tetraacyldisaccharide 4'-kinase